MPTATKDGYIIGIVACIFTAFAIILVTSQFIPSEYNILAASSITICAAMVAFLGVQRAASESRKTVLDTNLCRYAAIAYKTKHQIGNFSSINSTIQRTTGTDTTPHRITVNKINEQIDEMIDECMTNINDLSPYSAEKCIHFCASVKQLKKHISRAGNKPDNTNSTGKIVIGQEMDSQLALENLVKELDRDVEAGHQAALRLRLRPS